MKNPTQTTLCAFLSPNISDIKSVTKYVNGHTSKPTGILLTFKLPPLTRDGVISSSLVANPKKKSYKFWGYDCVPKF